MDTHIKSLGDLGQGGNQVGGIAGENYTKDGKIVASEAYGRVNGSSAGAIVGYNGPNTVAGAISGNKFSQSGTGQGYGIGFPRSNNGCEVLP
ncbi:MAG: hypothetical protein LBP21_08845 [Synergistaceae bacterium]|jgi:hypothetical protein|nr:hypothetical protein [Synergistaceae bacterium]